MIDELSRHATVRYEHGSGVTIDRLQGRDAREFDGVTMFGRVDEKLGRRQDHRRTALGCRIVFTRCAMAWPRDASLTPPGRTIGSAKRLSQDTTQLRNGTGIQAHVAE
jgi:hypothetical protein